MVTGKGYITGQPTTSKLLNMEPRDDENECTLLTAIGSHARRWVLVSAAAIIPIIKDPKTNKAYGDLLSDL